MEGGALPGRVDFGGAKAAFRVLKHSYRHPAPFPSDFLQELQINPSRFFLLSSDIRSPWSKEGWSRPGGAVFFFFFYTAVKACCKSTGPASKCLGGVAHGPAARPRRPPTRCSPATGAGAFFAVAPPPRSAAVFLEFLLPAPQKADKRARGRPRVRSGLGREERRGWRAMGQARKRGCA